NNRSFVVLTDTGYCSDHIRGTIENADAYLVESNHEIEILRAAPYPWSLKQRILGDKAHLSNDDGALVMAEVLGDKT
ncbi:MBL fold metallo-hydrolase, partial [Enterococcus faecalis]